MRTFTQNNIKILFYDRQDPTWYSPHLHPQLSYHSTHPCSLYLLISQADLLAVSWKHQASCHHRPFAPASPSAWDTCSQELSHGLLPHFIWYSTSVNALKENFPAMYSSFPIFLKFYTLPNFFFLITFISSINYIFAYFLLSLLEYRHFGGRNLIHLAHYYIPNTHNNTSIWEDIQYC